MSSATYRSILVMASWFLVTVTARATDPCRAGAEALKRGELAQAEELLKQCLRTQPGQLFPYIQLCGLYQLQGNSEALHRIALQGLKRFPAEKRFYLTVGVQAGREKRYTRAIEVLSKGYRLWPDDPAFREHLASAHLGLGMELLDQGKNQAAEKLLRRATELVDTDVEAHLNLGRALHNLNQSLEALKEFDKVIALDPRLPLAHFHRGLVLHAMAEYDTAIAELGQEIENNPDYPPSYLFRGLSLITIGQWARALPDLEIAALRMPDNPKALFARARCLNELGKTAEAETGFRKTIELDPSDPAPVNALARLLSQTGREREGELLFQKASQLDRNLRTVRPGEIRYESPRPRKLQ